MDGDPMLALLVDHPDPWTLADLDALPEDWDVEIIDGTLVVRAHPRTFAPWTQADLDGLPESNRFEVIDGNLLVNAQANPLHHLAADRLCSILTTQLSDEVVAVREIGVALDPPTTTVGPDVCVVKRDEIQWRAHTQAPSALVLVAEVASPTTAAIDRTIKAEKCAQAGIPGFWRVELDPLRVIAYVLRDDAYAELGAWAAGETVEVDEPVRVRFDPVALLP
ncbi:Uma2 family endonuclease [Pimelobacter simplex]|uniref:Uma2 family endonuclease n=1 Tax=Nocardioides simplex TaxID=2045 RepID=UPI003AAF8957